MLVLVQAAVARQAASGTEEEEEGVPAIRINTSAPLSAVSTCAGAPAYCCGENGAWVEVRARRLPPL